MKSPLVPVSPTTKEFGSIEYKLQMLLDAPNMVVSECYNISIPDLNVQFKSFKKSVNPKNTAYVFIPTSSLSQSVSDISSQGIKVDQKKGFKFLVDGIDINKKDDKIEVLMLRVTLGNTLNYQVADMENESFYTDLPTSANLPKGYHSLRISERGDFMIFNSAQIKVCNLIRFKGGENLEKVLKKDDKCDYCNEANATIYCLNDKAKFCEKCDKQIHNVNKLLQKHNRIPLSEAKLTIEYCPNHPNVIVKHYCKQCQVPVCFECKMRGSHSKGDAASHTLVEINEAISDTIEASKNDDIIFTKRMKSIDEKLAKADEKLQVILKNQKDVEEEINRIAQAAIAKTREMAGEKALVIRSNKTELLRKKNELNNLKKFIEIQRDVSNSLTFLKTFDRHEGIIYTLRKTNDIPLDLTVEGDLCVFGNLTVEPAKSQSNTKKVQIVQSKNEIPQKTKFEENNEHHNSNKQKENQESVKTDLPKNSTKNQENPKHQKKVTKEKNDKTSNGEVMNQSKKTEKKKLVEIVGDQAFAEQDLSGDEVEQNQNNKKPRRSIKRMSDYGQEYTSLIALAERYEQRNKKRGLVINFEPFQESKILTTTEKRNALYFCIPFNQYPKTTLLFSTERDSRSIRKMHMMIDQVGLSIVIIKKGQYLFGGFASSKWNHDGIPFGDPLKCFIFSISQDAIIPFVKRVEDACCLYATEDTLTFGKFDIILSEDFDECSANIEFSYSIGYKQGSPEAKSFLAGEPNFRADIVEVWGFYND